MKLSTLTPMLLLSLGTLTACGGGSKSPAPTKDTTAPVITLNGESSLTVSAGTAYVDLGASANDATDGNVTVTTTGTVDSSKVNSYTLTYSATDAAGNKGSTTRTVNVVDDTAPVLVLNGVSPITHNVGDVYTDLGALVTDNVDDANSITITATGEVNADVIGSYNITYSATDAAGNAATPIVRTVNVVDVTPPVITLNGDAVITLSDSQTYTEKNATVSDNVTDNVVVTITGEVLTEPATYIITYTAIDDAENEATVTRTVIVEEDIVPEIFTFTAQSDVFLNTVVESDPITITGLNVAAAVSITDGEFSINGGDYTAVTSNITSGQNIKVRSTSGTTVNELKQVGLTIGSLTSEFEITTRTAEPSGLFEGTGTVNGATSLTSVKAIIYNEHFILFDELSPLLGESVLYDGSILTYTGNEFTATVDVYKDGVNSQTVTATGSITNQSTFVLTLSGDTADYGKGNITVSYDGAYLIPATQPRFKTESAQGWGGQYNTATQGNYLVFKAETDINVFSGKVIDNANNGCIYENEKLGPNDSVNVFVMEFDTVDFGNSNCDHIGTGYKGYASIFNVGVGGVMWFAATNGVNSTFSVLTYQ